MSRMRREHLAPLFIAIAAAFLFAGSAQAQKPLDLSGLWVRDDGGVVKFAQDGQKIRATHVELAVPVRDVFGFRPGDDHMVGVLQGRTLRGKMYVHLPVGWKARCPEQWARLADIELTVSEDGNTIEGRWEWHQVTDKDCSIIRKEWQPRRYARSQPTVTAGLGHLSVLMRGPQLTTLRLALILDASGSMWAKVGARTRIDIAKEVMAQVVEKLPDDAEVALRVYGHRIGPGKPGACEDSELVLPFAKIDKRRLLERIRAIRALGTTPIAYSLRQVAKDFRGVPGEKMVLLVTDGKEECGGSPSQEAQHHYWVQWSKDGRWIDLDPSFPDARPGQAYAKPDAILPTLPVSLAHQVRVRIIVEEYTGSTASTR